MSEQRITYVVGNEKHHKHSFRKRKQVERHFRRK